MDATDTPAEMIFADASAAEAADRIPSYNPASTTPHSLMHELPPRPPSPYKSMQHKLHRSAQAKASVTSTFLRGRRTVPGVPAAPAASAEREARGAEWSESAEHALDYRRTKRGDSAVVHADTETHDSAMQQFLVFGVPRQRIVEREESTRNALLAGEEVAFTGLLIHALQERAELLAGHESEELVVAAALQRAEARQEMLKVIEVEVAARLREQRVAEMLEVQFAALLPAHAAGYERIKAEEREGLKEVFQWHKEHRPLGPGCFIKGPEEDYRLRSVSRGTSAGTSPGHGRTPLAVASLRSTVSSTHSSREYAAQLRDKNSRSATPNAALGELALLTSADDSGHIPSTQDGTFGPAEEAIFAEEGRLRLQSQKARKFAELQDRRRFTDLAEAQADARQYVLAEEALCWMHIIQGTVDGHYAAAEATRVRLASEATANAARAERDAERAAMREEMLRARGVQAPSATESTLVEDITSPAKVSKVGSSAVAGGSGSGGDGTTAERRATDAQRKSMSTVADSMAATDASLDPLPDMEENSVSEEAAAEADAAEAPLPHLRLIAEETEPSAMCRQLTTLTSGEEAVDDLDEL